MNADVVRAAAQGSGTIDLSGSFNKFWNTLVGASGMGQITNLLSIVGVALVAWALVKWAWDRRRGGGAGNSGGIWGALLVGAILSAPSVLMPIGLTFMDVVVNGAIKIWNSSTGG